MSNFAMIDNGDGTYRIECFFVVYREKFGHHPDFLPQNEERGKHEGFSTKFWFLIEDDLSENNASVKLTDYRRKYDDLISEIENDDTRWDEFPFRNKPLIYSK